MISITYNYTGATTTFPQFLNLYNSNINNISNVITITIYEHNIPRTFSINFRLKFVPLTQNYFHIPLVDLIYDYNYRWSYTLNLNTLGYFKSPTDAVDSTSIALVSPMATPCPTMTYDSTTKVLSLPVSISEATVAGCVYTLMSTSYTHYYSIFFMVLNYSTIRLPNFTGTLPTATTPKEFWVQSYNATTYCKDFSVNIFDSGYNYNNARFTFTNNLHYLSNIASTNSTTNQTQLCFKALLITNNQFNLVTNYFNLVYIPNLILSVNIFITF